MFSTECSKCGSKDHATSNCPHGWFSDKCDKCGSQNHATADCPHGWLSDKCDKCGSKDHATADCPQGWFSDKCDKCGSREHATGDCPHGIFSDKCAKCGSRNHTYDDCPHRWSNQGGSDDSFSGGEGGSGGGLMDSLGDKAAMVGGGIGAVIGFIAAIQETSSVGGFLAYIGIGLAAGAATGAFLAAILPWVILLGIVALLLQTCMG